MKAVFFDVDGTIVSDDGRHYIPESTREAIRRLRQNGCMTFVNTGRVYCNVDPVVEELGFDGYLCGCGTHVVVGGEEVFYREPDRARCRDVAQYLHALGYEVLYEHRDGVFFDFDTATERRSLDWRTFFQLGGKDVSRGIDHPDFVFDKFIVWLDPNDQRQAVRDYTSEDFEPILRSESTGEFFEVVPKGCTKATAIQTVVERFHIAYDDLYAIGDGENDLPMLRAVPHSIAMEGNPNVYPYVSYVTDTLQNDGLMKAMRHYGLV